MSRICFCFYRSAGLRYISHLDMMRLWQRALHRSSLPVAYSQGYNPHMRFNLAAPLPLGVTASEEYGELFFSESISARDFLLLLKPQLPVEIGISGAGAVDEDLPALPALVEAAGYSASLISSGELYDISGAVQKAVSSLLEKSQIEIVKQRKKGKTGIINIRPYIFKAEVVIGNGESAQVNMILQAGSRGGVAPSVVLGQLDLEAEGNLPLSKWELHRSSLYCMLEGSLRPLPEGMCFKEWIKN